MAPSYRQQELLVEFLEKHRQLAAGTLRNREARHKAKQLWTSLAVRLNAVDGAQKDASNWSKYWTDKKSYLKKISSTRKASADKMAPVSELDQRMIDLLSNGYGSGDVKPFTSQPHSKQSVPQTAWNSFPAPAHISSQPSDPSHGCDGSDSSGTETAPKPAQRSGATTSHTTALGTELSWLQEVEQRKLKIKEQRLAIDQQRLQLDLQRAHMESDRHNDLIQVARDLNETFSRMADGLLDLARSRVTQ